MIDCHPHSPGKNRKPTTFIAHVLADHKRWSKGKARRKVAKASRRKNRG